MPYDGSRPSVQGAKCHLSFCFNSSWTVLWLLLPGCTHAVCQPGGHRRGTVPPGKPVKMSAVSAKCRIHRAWVRQQVDKLLSATCPSPFAVPGPLPSALPGWPLLMPQLLFWATGLHPAHPRARDRPLPWWTLQPATHPAFLTDPLSSASLVIHCLFLILSPLHFCLTGKDLAYSWTWPQHPCQGCLSPGVCAVKTGACF